MANAVEQLWNHPGFCTHVVWVETKSRCACATRREPHVADAEGGERPRGESFRACGCGCRRSGCVVGDRLRSTARWLWAEAWKWKVPPAALRRSCHSHGAERQALWPPTPYEQRLRCHKKGGLVCGVGEQPGLRAPLARPRTAGWQLRHTV